MASLFGGSEQIDLLTPGQEGLLNLITRQIGRQFGEPGPVYEGPTAPGASPLQGMGFDLARQLGTPMPGMNEAIQAMLRGESVTGDPEDYYQRAVYNPARLQLDDAIRDIEARYGSQRGGGYDVARGEAYGRFGTGIGQTLADLTRADRFHSDDLRARGVTSGFGQTSNIANSVGALLGAGGTQRGVQADLNLANMNRWQAQQPYNNPWLSLLGPALNTQAYGVGQQQGALPGIMGGAGALLMGAGAFA